MMKKCLSTLTGNYQIIFFVKRQNFFAVARLGPNSFDDCVPLLTLDTFSAAGIYPTVKKFSHSFNDISNILTKYIIAREII